jgi:hypothetical protein
MSIQAQVETLKRANATAKAAQSVVAKRGMFALVETRHRYRTLLAGGISEHVSFTPGIVSSVDRAGMAKEVRCAGDRTLKRRDWDFCHVDSRGIVANPESVIAALVDEFGGPKRFDAMRDAQAAIKAAAGL